MDRIYAIAFFAISLSTFDDKYDDWKLQLREICIQTPIIVHR